MPRHATTEQRIVWHMEHARRCACQPIPFGLQAEIAKRDEAGVAKRAAAGAAKRAAAPARRKAR